MPFVKIAKNKAYFSRYQVKYRRRREGKTDYQARRRLVLQDKTLYNTPKFRLVVRITNADVVAQIIQAKLTGDHVLMAAYSHELKQFGVPVGLTNYSACYATGLLLARRVLTKLGIADKYAGQKNVDGAYFSTENEEAERRPFKAILDVGLARTTTGARIFGVLKGACDGGINVPHGDSRFPGFKKDTEKLDATIHRDRIFGKHVAQYMKLLEAEDQDQYKKHFSRFIKAGIKADGIEAMYKKCHEAIRANPTKRAEKKKRDGQKHKSYKQKPKSLKERKYCIRQKLQTARAKAGIVIAE